MIFAFRWKHPHRIAMCPPVIAQQLYRPLGQRHITVFAAFAVPHVQHSSRAVDVSHPNVSAFLQSQAARIDSRKTDSIPRQSHSLEYPQHLFHAQDHWQLLLALRSYKFERREVSVQRFLIEELDPADRDCRRGSRVLLDSLDVQEILSEFF